MTSINRFDPTLAYLRKAIADRASSGKAKAGANQLTGETAPLASKEKKAQIQRRIRERLLPLDLSQPADQEKGATIFLETVLANEFGVDLLDDPAFYTMVVDVRDVMLADTVTQQNLVNMLVDLKDSNQA